MCGTHSAMLKQVNAYGLMIGTLVANFSHQVTALSADGLLLQVLYQYELDGIQWSLMRSRRPI